MGTCVAFENANSKPLDVLSVVDVDAEKLVDNILVEILKLRFGRDFEPKLFSQYWSWSLVKIFVHDFESEI